MSMSTCGGIMKTISDAELEVMQLIWDHEGEPMTVKEIQQNLISEKQWKITTVQTFIKRLTDKGYLNVEKINGLNKYNAKVSRDAFSSSETKKIINTIHSGSVKDFVASLIDSDDLTSDDIDDLRNWLNDHE